MRSYQNRVHGAFHQKSRDIILALETKRPTVHKVLAHLLKGIKNACETNCPNTLALNNNQPVRNFVAAAIFRFFSGKVQLWLNIPFVLEFGDTGDEEQVAVEGNAESLDYLVDKMAHDYLKQIRSGVHFDVLRFDLEDVKKMIAKHEKWLIHTKKFVKIVELEEQLPLPRNLSHQGDSKVDYAYRCVTGRQSRLRTGRCWCQWADIARRRKLGKYRRSLVALNGVHRKTSCLDKFEDYMKVYFSVFSDFASEMERVPRLRCKFLVRRRVQATSAKDALVLSGHSSRNCRRYASSRNGANNFTRITPTKRSSVPCLTAVGGSVTFGQRPHATMSSKELVHAIGHITKCFVVDEHNTSKYCPSCLMGKLDPDKQKYRVFVCSRQDCPCYHGIDRDISGSCNILRIFISFLIGEQREVPFRRP